MNRSDPANLAELNDDIRRALDDVPAAPGPDWPEWLIAQTELQRFPMLWDAVRTTWHRDLVDQPSLADTLVDHTDHVLRSQFRVERGLEGKLGGLPPAPDVTSVSVQEHAALCIDGVDHAAVRIDSDPHVFAIGARLDDHTIATMVVSREELDYLQLSIATRTPESRTAGSGGG